MVACKEFPQIAAKLCCHSKRSFLLWEIFPENIQINFLCFKNGAGSCRTPCGGVFSVSLGKHHPSLLFYSNCFKLLSFLKTPNSYFEFVHGTKMPREMFVKFGLARVGNYLPLNLRFNTLHLSLAFCIELFTR